MKFSLKHFILGALIGLIPVFLYADMRLVKHTNSSAQVLSIKTEYVPNTEFIDISGFVSSEAVFQKPAPTTTPTPFKPLPTKAPQNAVKNVQKTNSPAYLTSLIQKYALEYGANPDMMIHIAYCESTYKENAVNGPYAGLYQFVSSTWVSNRKAMGLDPNPDLRFNAEESVKTAAFKMGRDGYGAWPVCQAKAKRLLGLAS